MDHAAAGNPAAHDSLDPPFTYTVTRLAIPHQAKDLSGLAILGKLPGRRSIALATFAYDGKITRVQRTLRRLEEDAPLLAMRVKDLSPERQKAAKSFAARMIDEVRAELERLEHERVQENEDADLPCEPAD